MNKKEYVAPTALVRNVRLKMAVLSAPKPQIPEEHGASLQIFNQGTSTDFNFGHSIGVDNNEGPFSGID